MKLIIQIQGREAIPVRAIPLLTNWRFFTPDVVAQVLAGDKALDGFVVGTLQAFHFQDGAATVFPRDWWERWAARELRACSDTIKSNQPSHEPGYQQWRDESLPMLPAGAFVWKDEFERLHAQNWDRKIRLFGCVSSGNSEDEQNSPISRNLAAFVDEGLTSLEEWRELDFSPYVRPALWSVVMEGVPPQQAAPSLAAAATASAEMSDPAKVERKAKLDEMLRKIKTPSIADVEFDAEVEELLSQREDAKAMLARREEVLSNPSALGNIKNLEDAEMAVSTSKQAVKTIEERIRVMRGDYTGSYQAPQPQVMTPSPAPVVAVGALGGLEPNSNLPWWRVAYDIHDMAQNIGAARHSKSERTSNTEIAKEIENRINDIERSKARDRRSPTWDTIRGVLTGWAWRPE